MFRKFLAIGLASLSLAACAPSGGDINLSGALYERVQTTLKRGDFVRLGPFVSTSPTCAKMGQARARLLLSPRNGRVVIGSKPGEIFLGEENRHAYCNGRSISGVSVEYRARPGFSGEDQFAFGLVFPDGERRTIHVDVHAE